MAPVEEPHPVDDWVQVYACMKCQRGVTYDEARGVWLHYDAALNPGGVEPA